MVTSSFISGCADEVESLDLRSSRALIFSNISVGTGSVLSPCRPEGMWCYAALRKMARKIFSHFWQLVGSHLFQLVLNLSTVSVSVCLFQVDAGTMLYWVDSDVHLQINEDW